MNLSSFIFAPCKEYGRDFAQCQVQVNSESEGAILYGVLSALEVGERLTRVFSGSRFERQKDLALAIGRSESAVSLWLSGAQIPDRDSLVALAGTLNVSVDWLLGFRNDITPPPAGEISDHEEELERRVVRVEKRFREFRAEIRAALERS